MTGCGTSLVMREDGRSGFENSLLLQNEDLVQEVWDEARRVTCLWRDRLTKDVLFDPFRVEPLVATDLTVDGDDVRCWMSVLAGSSPLGLALLDGTVRIGDPLTLAVYVQDAGAGFDVSVHDCAAYDSADIASPSTLRLNLSDSVGCSLKPKLMEDFRRTGVVGDTGADLIAYAVLNAFKFPDSPQVFIACKVDICKDSCGQSCYRSDPSVEIPTLQLTTTTTTAAPTTTVFTCTAGSLDPRCPPSCYPGSVDPRCPKPTTTTSIPTTTAFSCSPGSVDPRCPPSCYPGSLDPRCPKPTTSTTTTTTYTNF